MNAVTLAHQGFELDPADPDVQAGMAGLQVFLDKTVPKLVDLTQDQRRQFPPMNAKTDEMCAKAQAYAQSYPGIAPGFVDKDRMQRRAATKELLITMVRMLEQAHDVADDSLLVVRGADYDEGRAFYDAAKSGARRGISGAERIAEDLGRCFQGQGAKSPATPAPSDTTGGDEPPEPKV